MPGPAIVAEPLFFPSADGPGLPSLPLGSYYIPIAARHSLAPGGILAFGVRIPKNGELRRIIVDINAAWVFAIRGLMLDGSPITQENTIGHPLPEGSNLLGTVVNMTVAGTGDAITLAPRLLIEVVT